VSNPQKAADGIIHVSWQTFGEVLRRLRKRQGLSQERLAHLLGCDRTYIWRLEQGRNHPSRMFLHHLRNTCAVTAQDSRLLLGFMQLHEYHCDELELVEADFKEVGR
jgi:transcriptional regulator with XRE-family HTH domain